MRSTVSPMKRVLVPMSVRKIVRDEAAMHYTPDSYIEKLVGAGLTPIFVSALMPKEVVDELYKESGAVLFIGGSDFDSSLYGEEAHEQNTKYWPERDELELYILRRTLKDKKPFLGICRGCQALAIASGGTLHQHTPDMGIAERHHTELPNYRPSSNIVEICIETGSRLSAIFGKDCISVCCAHHQSVKTVGEGFKVSARSKGGVIEAIEHENADYFCLGVQFHPESKKGLEIDRIFDAFSAVVP